MGKEKEPVRVNMLMRHDVAEEIQVLGARQGRSLPRQIAHLVACYLEDPSTSCVTADKILTKGKGKYVNLYLDADLYDKLVKESDRQCRSVLRQIVWCVACEMDEQRRTE